MLQWEEEQHETSHFLILKIYKRKTTQMLLEKARAQLLEKKQISDEDSGVSHIVLDPFPCLAIEPSIVVFHCV